MEKNKREMSLVDILVAANLKLYDFCEILCDVFTLNRPELFITESYEDLLEMDMESIKVFCLASRINGDFSWLLTLHIYDLTLFREQTEIARKISAEANSICIVPDDSTRNPYSYIAFCPDGRSEKISMDPMSLESEVFKISNLSRKCRQ